MVARLKNDEIVAVHQRDESMLVGDASGPGAGSSLPEHGLITAVTLAELSVGPLVIDDEEERAARQLHLQQAEADFDPIPFDAEAARRFGQVAASLRRSGRRASARSYDAMIAAIAISRDFPIHTTNGENFGGIDGLHVLDVPHPDR